MKLYSAGEIDEKLPGVTSRQITDISEKKMIDPARETTGAGSPRLYDMENIFDICVCVALRGKLPAGGYTVENVKEILREIKRGAINLATMKPIPIEYLYIGFDENDKIYTAPLLPGMKISYVSSVIPKNKPQQFCPFLLEVAELRKFLEDTFR